jgi:hypothetical protein
MTGWECIGILGSGALLGADVGVGPLYFVPGGGRVDLFDTGDAALTVRAPIFSAGRRSLEGEDCWRRE